MKMDDMINSETGRKHDILIELRKLNKKGYQHMMAPYLTFKPKYKILQKKDIWKQAKRLIIEYTLLTKGNLRCDICDRPSNDLVLHHRDYVVTEIFNPSLTQLIHARCHAREHL